jgi:hypothetical protein
MEKIKIALILVLIFILAYPAILQQDYDENFIELYINNYEEIPLTADSFEISFSIRNQNTFPVNISYTVVEEYMNVVSYIDYNNAYIFPKEVKTFNYQLKNINRPSKFSIYIPETKQDVHFWVKES